MAVLWPVRESLRQVSEQSWILGNRMSISRQLERSPDVPSWSDGNGCFFEITKSSGEIATNVTHSVTDSFPLVHDAGDIHAVWKIGTAFLKVMIPASTAITREHVTLQALQDQGVSFGIPSVLFYGEWDGRYYLIVSQVPGNTLADAWPLMDGTCRNKCVSQVVRICKELAATFDNSEGSCIAGIDGGHLPEYFLGKRSGKDWDFAPGLLLQYCLDMKMDCSALVFYHCDLSPGNVMVHMKEAGEPAVGIIDWECAGFVPKEWVRTKYLVCGSMDFELPEGSTREARREWRDRMERCLEEEGFKDISESWRAWFATGCSRYQVISRLG